MSTIIKTETPDGVRYTFAPVAGALGAGRFDTLITVPAELAGGVWLCAPEREPAPLVSVPVKWKRGRTITVLQEHGKPPRVYVGSVRAGMAAERRARSALARMARRSARRRRQMGAP